MPSKLKFVMSGNLSFDQNERLDRKAELVGLSSEDSRNIGSI